MMSIERTFPFVFLIMSYCQQKTVPPSNSKEIFPFSFPIELGQVEGIMTSVFENTLIIASKDGKVFELDIYKGIKENTIKTDGEIKEIVHNYIISEKGNIVSLYSTSGKKEYEFILDSKKYSFVSPSEIVFWKEGKFFSKTATSEFFLFTEDNEPQKIFAFRLENNTFVVWNSNRQSWWWSNGVKKRLGQYTEKEDLYFYLSEGSYVAISTREVLGIKQNVRLFYDEDKEIKDFSMETTFGYVILKVPQEKFPVNKNTFITYDVIPDMQDDFKISSSKKDIIFLDTQEKYERLPELCSVYLGRYINSNFRREVLLPISSCKSYLSSGSVFFSVSLFSESLYQSFLFLFWGTKLFKKDIFYGEVYPIFLSDIPYLYLIIYDGDRKVWSIEARSISF